MMPHQNQGNGAKTMYRKDFIKGLLVAGVAATALALGAGSAAALSLIHI